MALPEFSFLAGGTPDDPSSQQAMLMRQKIALAMMAQNRKGYPKNIGEGITAIGEGLGERFATDRAMNTLAAFEQYAREHPAPTAADIESGKVKTGTVPGAGAPAAVPPVTAPRADIPGAYDTAAAPGVPPANPTDTEATTPPVTASDNLGGQSADAPGPPIAMLPPAAGTMSDAPPVGMPNSMMAFAAGKPAEAADNPPIPSDIKPMPTQLAQAGPATPGTFGPVSPDPRLGGYTPPVNIPGQAMPKPPSPLPFNKTEEEGQRILSLGQRTMNQSLIDQGNTLKATGEARRKAQEEINWKQHEILMQNWNARVLATEGRQVGARKTEQEIIPKANAPVVNPASGVGPTGPVLPGVDPALNTAASPQRVGVPDLSKPAGGVSPEVWQQVAAPMATKAMEALQNATPQFALALKTIDLVRNHPGLPLGTGATAGLADKLFGTDMYNFEVARKQLLGENFMAGYSTLRGGGSISNAEGTKTEQARARLAAPQSKEAFQRGLDDLETSVRSDLEQVQRRMRVPVTAWQRGPNDAYAPDVGSVDTRINKDPNKLYEYIGGNPGLDSSYRDYRPGGR